MGYRALRPLPADAPREAPHLRLALLGDFRVERDRCPLPEAAWGRRAHARTLLKLLALAPGHRLHREEIVDLLWPDADRASANNRFAKALHAARHALQPALSPREPSSFLQMRGDLLILDTARAWIDVDHFEALADAAGRSGEAAAYEAALDAYGGDLLPGDRYEEWAAARRVALRERYVDLLLGLAGALERSGDAARAGERWRQALALDAAREEAHRGLMRLYAASGSRHQALRQYQTCRAALQEELGARPDAATDALHREIVSSAGSVPEASMHTHEGADVSAASPAGPQRSPSGGFVGRESLLEALLARLNAAAAGRGELVLMGGELGVGKTRLLAEFTREALSRHAVVLRGAAYAEEGVVPYGPLAEALDGYLAGMTPVERDRFAASFPELGRVHPAFAHEDDAAEAADADAERARLFAAVVRLLDRLSAARPVLLTLDDLHAADEASLHLLHHLARAAPGHRWLLLCAYREEDVAPGSPLAVLRASLTRQELCRRIDLQRLDQPDGAQLIAALLPGGSVDHALVERLHAFTLGNPLFLHEVVRALREQGALALRDGAWRETRPDAAAPRSVRDLVQARARALGDAAYRTLSLAAVAGMTCSFAELRAAGDLQEDALLDALDRALMAHLLEESRDGYTFRHPLFRAALYEQLSLARRAWLHGRLARTLEALRPDAVEALAYHYGRSAEREQALRYLEQAGDRARAVYANDVAAGYYRDLVERLGQVSDERARAGANEKLGNVLVGMARFEEALPVLAHAEDLYRALDDPEGHGRVAILVGRSYASSGRPQEGSAYLRGAFAALEARIPARITAALLSALAMTCFAGGRYAEQLAAARRAVAAAQRSGDRRAQAEAGGWRGLALLSLTRLDEARAVLEGAVSLAEAAGDLGTLSGALNNLGAVYLRRGEFDRHVRCVERALALAERQGDPFGTAYFLGIVGCSDFYRGDWRSARERLQRAEAMGRAHPSWVTPYPLLELGELYLGMGDWERASRYLEESSGLAEGYGDLQCLREVGCLLAERDLLVGHPEAASSRLDALLAAAERAHADLTDLLVLRAWAHHASGEACAAERTLDQGIARAKTANNRFLLVGALRVQGIALTGQGRWDEAAAALEEGMALARAMPYPYAEARLLHAYGLLVALQGDAVTARQRLDAALAAFRRLGARQDERHARADRLRL